MEPHTIGHIHMWYIHIMLPFSSSVSNIINNSFCICEWTCTKKYTTFDGVCFGSARYLRYLHICLNLCSNICPEEVMHYPLFCIQMPSKERI